MLTLSSSIRRSETPDGAVLLDIAQGQMFCLNPVGSKILELMGSGCDEHEMADQVSAAYDADIEIVRADVHEFLEALSQHGILNERGSAATGEKKE
jgi:hypothetical protein